MKPAKLWLIAGVLALLIGGAVWFAVANQDDMPSYSQPDTKTTTNENGGQNATTAGAYVDYNEQVFAETQGRRWLFFHAGWCPQCRALEGDITKEGVPDGVTIFKVDYDTATDLKKKYGVTLQTTIVEVDDKGNEIQKIVAYDDPTLQAIIIAFGG